MAQGWQGCEDQLRLSGWSTRRRVIVMRRERKINLVLERRGKDKNAQTELLFIDENEPVKSWEYAVLVSNGTYSLEQIGQLYRDRADCENGFDEIKNQWGWGGYSTHDIERCALSARAVALIYNWWSWYVRLANPKSRLEAKTSRPKLLSAVGRLSTHGRVNKIVLALTHEAAGQIKAMIANVRAGIEQIRDAAPQFEGAQRWFALARYITEKILAFEPYLEIKIRRIISSAVLCGVADLIRRSGAARKPVPLHIKQVVSESLQKREQVRLRFPGFGARRLDSGVLPKILHRIAFHLQVSREIQAGTAVLDAAVGTPDAQHVRGRRNGSRLYGFGGMALHDGHRISALTP